MYNAYLFLYICIYFFCATNSTGRKKKFLSLSLYFGVKKHLYNSKKHRLFSCSPRLFCSMQKNAQNSL